MTAPLGVLGGDRRQQWLATLLAEEGRPILTSALGLPGDVSPLALAAACDTVVLPLPLTRDGASLYAPLAPLPVPLSDSLAAALSGKFLLAGGLFSLSRAPAAWQALAYADYSADETFLSGNARLTALSALPELIQHTPGGLSGAEVLLLGWGRIARALASLLRPWDVRLTCAARSPEARRAIAALGCTPSDFSLARPFHALINTVPAPVAGEALLSRQTPETLLLELASAPGGFDRSAAARLGLPLRDLPGLPGKRTPRGAAILLKSTLERMML